MARLSTLILAFSAATAVSALPHWGPRGGRHNWNWNAWTASRDTAATPTLPLDEANNSGPSPLPTPTTAVKYVLLGVGFQNYSCASTGAYVQSVPSAGAVADLYDITRDVDSDTKDTITKNALKAFEACIKWTKCSPSVSNGYCDSCRKKTAAPFKRSPVGDHYFDQLNGAQVPNFDIFAKGTFLSAKRAGGITAPADAYKGSNNLGTIAWLYLISNGPDRTRGLTSVYRVETAGGVAPSTCQPGATLQVPYAAEYWFYN